MKLLLYFLSVGNTDPSNNVKSMASDNEGNPRVIFLSASTIDLISVVHYLM